MERSEERGEDSTESGYDGGSQENILSEPHYETISKKSESPKEEVKVEEAKVPNGHAKFCNGTLPNLEEKEEEAKSEDNKLTIHAVIETAQNEEHTSSEDDLYEKIDTPAKPETKVNHYETVESDDSRESNKEVVYSNVSIQKIKKSEVNEEKREHNIPLQQLVSVAEDEGKPPKVPTPPPMRNFKKSTEDTTFVEEEYSYEPELRKTSSKLVLRTRSLLNLEEENTKSDRTYVRPTAVRMKITTGPDGTFMIDGRKANSELNLSDESRNGSPKETRTVLSGEALRKRKEEIFKQKELPNQDPKKYHEEINQNKKQTTKEEAIHNLKKYLKENNIGLKELLTNNNVVIIDTFREKKRTEDLADYNHKAVGDCRITGALTKGEARESHTLPRANKVQQPVVQRHYFYNLFKQKPSPPEEELPDPDKVRSTRQMFQKSREKVEAGGIMLPIAAKVCNPRKEARPTPEVRLIHGTTGGSSGQLRRWTDSGSVSSGVSSDMSQLDNLSDKCYTSEEEEMEPPSPTDDSHPVSPEVLNKIRACGTTVTYYGGRVISASHGPGSPMTMTIMDEIRQGRQGGCKGKFRLIKSNSCGSRLELAGTEEPQHCPASRERFYQDVYGGRPLSEEMRGSLRTVLEEQNGKEQGQGRLINDHVRKLEEITKNPPGETRTIDKKPSWRELIESRKQRKAMEHNRRPCPDMVFEEFQVLET